MKFLSSILFSLIMCLNLTAQTGRPFIRNYSPVEYSGEDQIWTVIQDNSGLMYFGGGNGIYIYDGKRWEFLGDERTFSAVLSSDIDEEGKTFWGLENGFGYLEKNLEGKYELFLLNKQLPENEKVTDVYSMCCKEKTAYFCADQAVYRYHPDSVPVLKNIYSENIPYLIYKAGNEVFLSDRNRGFFRVSGDSLIRMQGLTDFSPWFMLYFENGVYLTGSVPAGLQIYDSKEPDTTKLIKTYEFFDKEIIDKTNKILSGSQLYIGAERLSDELFAVGTITDGIYIINNKGVIVNKINKQKGLQSQTVHKLFKDAQNGLWAGLSYGISRLEISSPFRITDEKDGIKGIMYNVIRSRDGLYITTNLGMYLFSENRFKPVKELSDENSVQVFMPEVFNFSDGSEDLLIITIYGMYTVKKDRAYKINGFSPSSIFKSDIDRDKIFFTNDFSLYRFRKENGKFTKPELIQKFEGLIKGGQEMSDGKLWLFEDYKPVLFDPDSKKAIKFTKNNEISDVVFYYSANISDEPYFITNKGLYFYNDSTKRFSNSERFPEISKTDLPLSQILKVAERNLWVVNLKSPRSFIANFNYSGNDLITDSVSFKRTNGVNTLYADGDSLIWGISSEKIYKFHTGIKKDYTEKRRVIIRKVKLNNDSILATGYTSEISGMFDIPEIQYKDNDIHFEFSIPTYDNEDENEFSWILEGRRKDTWSEWSKESFKEYTNLREGDYIFKIKARNIYGKESMITEFQFVVLPPWYRSWWAFILYIILFAVIVYILVKLNARRLEKENIKLENIVMQRTAEISTQKEEIQTQADHLEEVNTELSMKNEEINAIAESLREANQKIKDKNEYILDSINYAKKIQTAILPVESALNEILKDYFVIYRPKDIVGGDFYYVKKIGKYIVLAVADCTGHGVPGGFLSMMGYSFINDIIRNEHIERPSDALNELRVRIKNALKQKEYFSGRTDGIDIALCVFDSEKKIMQYSGANISAYIVRKGNYDKLEELKADPQPVGIHYNEKDFTYYETPINTGDIVYMFSDGIYDQLGGESNKKYLLPNFKKRLLDISPESMKIQRRIILRDHLRWKGNNKQVDDILILGLRF